MDGTMAKKVFKIATKQKQRRPRRYSSPEYKQEAVQMLLDGHSARSFAVRHGIDHHLLYHRKRQLIRKAGSAARTIGDHVAQLEEELWRVERERDTLRKALATLGRMP